MKEIQELIELISLKQIDSHVFEGKSSNIGSANVFGGQVVAQGLFAMYQTIPAGRFCNSLHSYFILPGNLNLPIKYEVENIRDGGSFTTRRVLAKQEGKVIFFMAGSFHQSEKGYEHQIEMPNVKPPEELFSWDEMYEQMKDFLPQGFKQFLAIERPISFKPEVIVNPLEKKNHPPYQNVWIKIKGTAKDSVCIKQCILAYISDYNILTTALNPHASVANFANTQMASLDHSMWFHHDFDLEDWMLYSLESTAAAGARGFVKGNFFTRRGKLVVSVAQEGLMRPK